MSYNGMKYLEHFQMEMGLHQRSALNPFIFSFVMDELKRYSQDEVLWCILFVDDIILIDETCSRVSARLEVWKKNSGY